MIARFEGSAAFLIIILLSLVVGCGQGTDDKNAGGGDKTETSSDDSTKKTDLSSDTSSGKAKASDAKPKVAIETNLGTITVQLDPQKAVLTVPNFLQYVDDGHYEGTIFHDVNKGCAVIGGGYTKDMTLKKERHAIRNEAHNGLKNVRGTIAMVRKPDVIDSATCQFMFNLADNDFLDHKDHSKAESYGYCVFGKVVEGMDVVDKIGELTVKEVKVADGEPFPRVPTETVTISSIRRVK